MSDILHIKDSYYFEVPKALWSPTYDERGDFPKWWVELDSDYQLWEAHRLYPVVVEVFGKTGAVPGEADLIHEYEHWKHEEHRNATKPFERFLLESQPWFQSKMVVSTRDASGKLKDKETLATDKASVAEWTDQWKSAKEGRVVFANYDHAWSAEKCEGYSHALNGKILIPQVFGGELKNLYERESGFCVSKFMIIEIVVLGIILVAFRWVGKKIETGERPRGRVWNLLETFLLFIRDQVARPSIGHDADKFMPYLWTVFFFILGCNLMGLVPWAGAPTGAFAVTLCLAVCTFAIGIIFGSIKFGVLGYWWNQVPQMELPWFVWPIKLMIFAIEILGLVIKHGVLAVRLLANMVAGHLVLLGIMGLAFSLKGAMNPNWWLTAVISVVAATLFTALELFVAFLQAYIFTFLSALFIGAAVHRH